MFSCLYQFIEEFGAFKADEYGKFCFLVSKETVNFLNFPSKHGWKEKKLALCERPPATTHYWLTVYDNSASQIAAFALRMARKTPYLGWLFGLRLNNCYYKGNCILIIVPVCAKMRLSRTRDARSRCQHCSRRYFECLCKQWPPSNKQG